jgi:hypothetical protein
MNAAGEGAETLTATFATISTEETGRASALFNTNCQVAVSILLLQVTRVLAGTVTSIGSKLVELLIVIVRPSSGASGGGGCRGRWQGHARRGANEQDKRENWGETVTHGRVRSFL